MFELKSFHVTDGRLTDLLRTSIIDAIYFSTFTDCIPQQDY